MKKRKTIIVIDSGLGGLTVYSELSRMYQKFHIADEIDLIYVNAVYEKNYGYQNMKSKKEQISMFDWFLKSIYHRFNPDQIVVACNTLSTLLNKIEFTREHPDIVYGIVEPVCDFLVTNFREEKSRNIVIMGTPTTVSSKIYQNKLKAIGFPDEKIIPVACKGLETAIQNDPESELVFDLIDKYIGKAEKLIKTKEEPTSFLLACTHYSVVLNEINSVAETYGFVEPELIDSSFIQVIANSISKSISEKGVVNHYVYSRVPLFENGKDIKFVNYFSDISHPAYEAVMNYRQDENLF